MKDKNKSKGDTLVVPVIKVNSPCEECKSTNYPNLKYSLVGIEGVLCKNCLQKVVNQVNSALRITYNEDTKS